MCRLIYHLKFFWVNNSFKCSPKINSCFFSVWIYLSILPILFATIKNYQIIWDLIELLFMLTVPLFVNVVSQLSDAFCNRLFHIYFFGNWFLAYQWCFPNKKKFKEFVPTQTFIKQDIGAERIKNRKVLHGYTIVSFFDIYT